MKTKQTAVPANPKQWSEKSQRSVAFEWTSEYKDKHYNCWSCGKAAVYTAEDQKYTYEVRKAPIDQQRVLCASCWRASLVIAKELEAKDSQWAADKARLKTDREFLLRWQELLTQQEHYVRYKPHTAKKNMLRKLLAAE